MSGSVMQLAGHDEHKSTDPPVLPLRRRGRLSRNALFTALSILLPVMSIVSVLQIAFSNEAIKHGPPRDGQYPDSRSPIIDEQRLLGLSVDEYPAHIIPGLESIELASGSLNLVFAIAVGGIALHASSKGPIRTVYALRIAFVVVLAINVILSLATFVFAFVAYGQSAHFHLAHAFELNDDLSIVESYQRGIYDLGTWACETYDLPYYEYDGNLHTLCSVATGARWTTLILLPLASTLLALVWLDRRGGQHLVTTWKNRRSSWHEEYY
ncbi:hypothetical protein F4777DRAFT_381132 [Nemania sp. FL0916]|nr:hypothetical protein F4777DRAFT_381132 [Nemania sp. FL0916]